MSLQRTYQFLTFNTSKCVGEIAYQTCLSGAFDLTSREDVFLAPNEYKEIPTGLFITGHEIFNVVIDPINGTLPLLPILRICPRSSMAKTFLMLNSPGLVDADYPNEIMVLFKNHTESVALIEKGQRIAQASVEFVFRPGKIAVKGVQRTGGLGSTGK